MCASALLHAATSARSISLSHLLPEWGRSGAHRGGKQARHVVGWRMRIFIYRSSRGRSSGLVGDTLNTSLVAWCRSTPSLIYYTAKAGPVEIVAKRSLKDELRIRCLASSLRFKAIVDRPNAVWMHSSLQLQSWEDRRCYSFRSLTASNKRERSMPHALGKAVECLLAVLWLPVYRASVPRDCRMCAAAATTVLWLWPMQTKKEPASQLFSLCRNAAIFDSFAQWARHGCSECRDDLLKGSRPPPINSGSFAGEITGHAFSHRGFAMHACRQVGIMLSFLCGAPLGIVGSPVKSPPFSFGEIYIRFAKR